MTVNITKDEARTTNGKWPVKSDKEGKTMEMLHISKADFDRIGTDYKGVYMDYKEKSMRQKTFISDTEFKIGDLVFLVEKVNTIHDYSTWYAYKWDGEGMEGNMNPSIKRYHGWRGTTNNNAYYAHSVRKVLKVTPIYEDFDFPEHWKITVGKDLYPKRD